jgi:hypothetical protein
MTKSHGLPPESPHWWPIEQALEHRSQQTGSDKLAAQDFNRALKLGRLRALVRRADGPRELLTPSAWDDLYIAVLVDITLFVTHFTPQPPSAPRPGLAVFSHKLGKRPAECWFFVWLPDYKNIFGDLEPKSQSAEQVLERPEKRGRKAILPWTRIGFELARRAEKMGAAAGNKSTNSWATDLDQWCDDHKLKAPPNSELRVFIDDVLRALRIKRK